MKQQGTLTDSKTITSKLVCSVKAILFFNGQGEVVPVIN
jgi:hypothetical protein